MMRSEKHQRELIAAFDSASLINSLKTADPRKAECRWIREELTKRGKLGVSPSLTSNGERK